VCRNIIGVWDLQYDEILIFKVSSSHLLYLTFPAQEMGNGKPQQQEKGVSEYELWRISNIEKNTLIGRIITSDFKPCEFLNSCARI
jgi:hypothetical protein